MATASETIVRRAEEVGVEVRLHAAEIDGTRGLGIGEDVAVVPASVFKVPIALELARQAAEGALDLGARITVKPGHPTPSPYGLATFRHEVQMSWHDLAILMIGISDNVATDLILAEVGKAAVNDTLRRLGFTRTVVPQDCGELLATIGEDLGVSYEDDERALAELTYEQVSGLRALQPEKSCRTTAAEMTRLLGLIWRDEAAAPEACADVRRWMELQVWPHRLRSGFPDDRVRTSGKTGTLPAVRNEVGVVEYPDGGRYSVAVFTRAGDSRSRVPERDTFIGFAAATAVESLRTA
ncbi:serine hydrolase [Amycolatopsis rubida]|uniref:Beta-lactamase class A n=1 Tax=Amycolatopsis rubida TaxID=112413 RepID=A0A1I5JCR7_9PSEU|nr:MULTISPECIES: serine hydrolase [Amycolatopsis]MYW90173.1 serine hydrolase [Amycolatopsis rubida]NEC55150.1 serine hydrolase [Amycolatopsis rubida]OAP28563.1 Beta-lactamase regulatory protein BlaB [Amycolatopsis sp. M39]SFO70605.1 beta-lactamase class A [Amycolatopsis rubida]